MQEAKDEVVGHDEQQKSVFSPSMEMLQVDVKATGYLWMVEMVYSHKFVAKTLMVQENMH